MNIKLKSGEMVINFNLPDENEIEKWNFEVDKNYLPDKDKFIEDEFERAFGQLLESDLIYKLVGRNDAVKEWLVETNAKYEISVQCPQYFKEYMSDEEYKDLSKEINIYNSLNREEAEDIRVLSENYKKELNKISNKYKVKKDAITTNPRLRVLTLNSTKLPISLSLAIENYTPKDLTDLNSKRTYARETLIRYKQVLLQCIKDGKDVDALINDLSSKF